MNKILLSSIAAVAFALSASVALADAADHNFPDNPILAEQYFYDHQATTQQAASGEQAQPLKATHAAQSRYGQPRFTALSRQSQQ